jgi:hypothetical protein
MASDDRPKLPRATLRDGKLYIEGEKEPYFRDRKNKVRLRIDTLTIRRGYQDYRTGKVLTESLHVSPRLKKTSSLSLVLRQTTRRQLNFC